MDFEERQPWPSVKIAWNIGHSYFASSASSSNHPSSSSESQPSAAAMSSYQFVNSLASCYGQPRTGPESAGPGSDYYTPQAYNSCYGAANAASAPNPASPAAAAAYAGYLSQNGGDHTSHHGHHGHHGLASNYPTPGLSASQAPVPSQGRLGHPTRTPTPSSCKYAPVDSAASPQDLSTSSTGAGQSSEGSRGSPAAPTQSARGGSSSSTSTSTGQGLSNTPGSGENNNSGNSKNGQSGQPQIYPWMRKVHVGQSKFAKSKSIIIYSTR